jgi:hypothetical protein
MTNHRRNNWFEISGLQRFWPGVFQSRESAGCAKKNTDPKVTPAREFFSCHESGSLFQWTDHVTQASTKSGLLHHVDGGDALCR